MAVGDTWKEQLTLISGNFLVWGILLLKIWPLAAGLQTGANVHYLSTGGAGGKDVLFKFLTGTMAIAVGITTLASFHILCRGMWLAITGVNLKTSLDAICSFTFNATIALAAFLVFTTFFSLPLIYFEVGAVSLLMSHVGLSYNAANLYASVAVTVLTLASIFVLMIKRGRGPSKYLENTSASVLLPYILTLTVSMALGFIVLEGCYTLELQTNAAIYHQERGDVIEVYVMLGGATSSISDAKLKLIRPSSPWVEDLPLTDLGDGHYVAFIFSSKLPQGAYQLSLDYPHASLGLPYPFIHSGAQKSTGFLVIRGSP